jgi:hypothetical protein
MRGYRLNPFACAEGDERVQESCSAVVQTNTVYSGHADAGARREINRVGESLYRRYVVAGQCEAKLWARVQRAIGIQDLQLGFRLEASRFEFIFALKAC